MLTAIDKNKTYVTQRTEYRIMVIKTGLLNVTGGEKNCFPV